MNISLRIQNFKSLEDVTIDLKPTIFLFGPNGSGKSSVIEAILFLSANINELKKHIYSYRPIYNSKPFSLDSFFNTVYNNDTSKTINFEYSLKLSWKEYKQLFDIHFRTYEEYMKFDEDSILSFFESSETQDFIKSITKIDPCDMLELYESYDSLINVKYHFSFSNSKLIIKYVSIDPTFSIEINGRTKNVEFAKEISSNFESFFKQIWFYNPVEPREEKELYSTMPLLLYDYHKSKYEQVSKSEFLKQLIVLYKIHIVFPSLLNKMFEYIEDFGPIRPIPSIKFILNNDRFEGYNNYYYNNFLEKGEDGELHSHYSLDSDHKGFDPEFDHWNYIFKKLAQLELANKVYIEKHDGIGKVIVENINGSVSNLANSSSGLIQILPILVRLIDDDDIFNIPTFFILCEQPELHLHPRIQSNLAEIFLMKNDRVKNCKIIETHSEHLIRKVQVMIAKGEASPRDVAVYYFDKSEKIEMKIKENGLFEKDWPKGFFDDSSNLTFELFEAISKRQN